MGSDGRKGFRTYSGWKKDLGFISKKISLKIISRFVWKRAVDILGFRLYARKKDNWDLVVCEKKRCFGNIR